MQIEDAPQTLCWSKWYPNFKSGWIKVDSIAPRKDTLEIREAETSPISVSSFTVTRTAARSPARFVASSDDYKNARSNIPEPILIAKYPTSPRSHSSAAASARGGSICAKGFRAAENRVAARSRESSGSVVFCSAQLETRWRATEAFQHSGSSTDRFAVSMLAEKPC